MVGSLLRVKDVGLNTPSERKVLNPDLIGVLLCGATRLPGAMGAGGILPDSPKLVVGHGPERAERQIPLPLLSQALEAEVCVALPHYSKSTFFPVCGM